MSHEDLNGDKTDFMIEHGIIKSSNYSYNPDPQGLGYEILGAMKHFRDGIAQYLPDTDEHDTFGELLQRSVRTAIRMRSLGIKKNDMISLCSNNHKNTSVPYIAAIMLGVKVSSLDPRLDVAETVHLLKIVEPKMIFVNQDGVKLIEEAIRICDLRPDIVVFSEHTHYKKFDEFLIPSIEEDTFEAAVPHDLSEDVVILFSSGTTGLPKGIRLSHYMLMQKALEFFVIMGTKNRSGFSNYRQETSEAHSVYLCYSPFYWVSATLCLIASIISGSPRVISNQYETEEFFHLVDKYKITSTILTPIMLLEFVKHKIPDNLNLSSLRYVATGGSPVSSEILLKTRKMLPKAWISQIYGATETGCLATFFDYEKPRDINFTETKIQSCGRPIPGIWYKVVDPETEEIIGPYQRGELRMKGKAITAGYYNTQSQSLFDSNGWLCSGDIVYYDDDCCFYMVDRMKRMIKYRSWQVFPGEIEEIIYQHPAVKQAVVLGIPHPECGDLTAAVVVLNENTNTISEEEIKNFIDGKVSKKQKLRGGVKIVDHIPLTITGKVKTLLLKNMFVS